MNTEDIYDPKRNRIGKVVTQSDGNQDIYDVRGTRLGQYRKNENRTYDVRGTSIGFGNQLMRLLQA